MANNLQSIKQRNNNSNANNNINNNSNTETVVIDHEVLSAKEILSIDKIRSMYSEGTVDRGNYDYYGFTYARGDHIELRSRDAICLVYRVPVNGSNDYAYVVYYFDPNSPIINEDVRATEIIYPDGTVLRNDYAITTFNDTHDGSISPSSLMSTAYYPDTRNDLAYYNLYEDYWFNGVPHTSNSDSSNNNNISSIDDNPTNGNNSSTNNQSTSTSTTSSTNIKVVTPEVEKFEDSGSSYTIDQLREKIYYMTHNWFVQHADGSDYVQYGYMDGFREMYLNVYDDGTMTLFYFEGNSSGARETWKFDKDGNVEYNGIKYDKDGYAVRSNYITDDNHHILGIACGNDEYSFTLEGGITVFVKNDVVTERQKYSNGQIVTTTRSENGHYVVENSSGVIIEEGDSEESAQLYREYMEYAQRLRDVNNGQSNGSNFTINTEDSTPLPHPESHMVSTATSNGYRLDLSRIPGAMSGFEIAEKCDEIMQNGIRTTRNGKEVYMYNRMTFTKYSDGTMSLEIDGNSYVITEFYDDVDYTTGKIRSTASVSTAVIQGNIYSVDD